MAHRSSPSGFIPVHAVSQCRTKNKRKKDASKIAYLSLFCESRLQARWVPSHVAGLAWRLLCRVRLSNSQCTFEKKFEGKNYIYHVICGDTEVKITDLKCLNTKPISIQGAVWSKDVQDAVAKQTDEGILTGAIGTIDSTGNVYSYAWTADGIVHTKSTQFATITTKEDKVTDIKCLDKMYCNFDEAKVKAQSCTAYGEMVIGSKKDSPDRKWLLHSFSDCTNQPSAKCMLCAEVTDINPSLSVPFVSAYNLLSSMLLAGVVITLALV